MEMYQCKKIGENDKIKIISCDNIECFINCWEQYYWMNASGNKKNKIKIEEREGDNKKFKPAWINATLKCVEKYDENDKDKKNIRNIETILEDEEKDPLDVKKILAWKLGKIDMEKTKDGKDLVFITSNHENDSYGWQSEEKNNIKATAPSDYRGTIHLNEVCGDIVAEMKKIGGVKDYKSVEVIRFVNHYEENKGKEGIYYGVGLVYLITLLHFMTRGVVPIYDRFVHIALKALNMRKIPGDYVYYSTPDANDEKTYMALMDEYTWLMEKTIENKGRYLYRKNGDEKIEDIRKMDRALWVYGHLFNL